MGGAEVEETAYGWVDIALLFELGRPDATS
jgi:hypothetical protein